MLCGFPAHGGRHFVFVCCIVFKPASSKSNKKLKYFEFGGIILGLKFYNYKSTKKLGRTMMIVNDYERAGIQVNTKYMALELQLSVYFLMNHY